MPCPHFRITITKRSRGQSAVAGAAYQSGERLFSEYDQKTKNYHYKKKEVAHAEILLPPNAPPEYADRDVLWNAAEAVEKQWNAQLARRIVLALPREVAAEQYPDMLREFCREQFVSQGMCVDFAIHDKGDGNPHAHIMLTVRAMDANGKWLPKSRKVYDLDENGNRIRLPSGNWKSHKEDTVDWNEQSKAELWRHAWEELQNTYLERNGRPERVDLRSYARQGVEQIPTVHMGPAVAHMEAKGIETDIGNLNREIRETNRLLNSIRGILRGLKDWLAELRERKQILLAALEKIKQPTLPELLAEYYQLRSDERADWSSRAKLSGAAKDYEKLMGAIQYLRSHELITLDALHEHVGTLEARYADLSKTVKAAQRRMADIAAIREAFISYSKLKPIHTEYMKKNFQKAKDKYKQAHSAELESFNKALRFLKKVNGSTDVDLKALKAETARLEAKIKQASPQFEPIKAELQELKTIRFYVSRVVPEEPEPEKVSIEDRLSEANLVKERNRNQPQPQRPNKQHQIGTEL